MAFAQRRSMQLPCLNRIGTLEVAHERKIRQAPHEDYDAETKLNPEQEVAYTIIMERIN